MRTYELSLTTNYVMDWDFSMAIREIIQNGTDQETVDPYNRFSIEYRDGVIRFINTRSKLKINTLLLGRSSKSGNDETVGQFGEGYKIGALVLNRLGKTFTIYNNGRNEIWRSRFVNSRRWHDQIFVFDVEDHPTDEQELVIEVGNVTPEEYEDLQSKWLGFLDDYKRINTTYGEILMDPEQKNRIYVNGLFISCNAELQYGYNFKPAYLKLERDRKSCDTWDAQKLTGKMLSEAFDKGEIDGSDIYELVEDEADDVGVMPFINKNDNVCACLVQKLEEKYQEPEKPVIPVTANSDYEKVERYGGRPVFVNYTMGNLLRSETQNKIKDLMNAYETKEGKKYTVKEKLMMWLDCYEQQLSVEAQEKFKEILSELS